MNFVDAVKSGLNNYINFEGRAARSEYWLWFLFYMIVYIGALAIDYALGLGFVGLLISVALLAPSLSVATRRLHDINKSGWWQLICLIPIVGIIVLIVFYVKKGDAGANRFGQPVI